MQFNTLDGYLTQNPSPLKFLILNLPLFLINPKIGLTLTAINGSSWDVSMWTLKFEFGCYIAIALIVKLLSNFKKDKLVRIIFGIYVLLIILSLVYPRQNGFAQRNLFNLFVYGINFFSIFLGGSIIYLIKDKLVFNEKFLSLAIMFCILIMSILPQHLANEICAIPMLYIILYISLKLKSPKFIQENDISYGIYIYAWPIQCLIAIIMVVYGYNINIWIYDVVCFIVTSIFALFSWFIVEKPILNRVRRLF